MRICGRNMVFSCLQKVNKMQLSPLISWEEPFRDSLYNVADVLCVSPLPGSIPTYRAACLPARQVLFCSFCVLPVFKDSSERARKETNSSDFVTRLVLFPRTSYVLRGLRAGRILAGLVVKIFFPKGAQKRPLSWIPPA